MITTAERRLPVGIQSFRKIREGHFLYVDKTDTIWRLVNKGKQYNYLSRPRRFGKSVLVDTLQCYFEGRRDLFEGLKIMEYEKDWTPHPVIRLDLSRGGASGETLRSYFHSAFKEYERKYGIEVDAPDSLPVRFDKIIRAANEATGQQVAILIDEYDAPLQHSWHTSEHEACTTLYREVFAKLKADDEYECFVFITGITKFTQISLFSVMNNLSNISFDAEYASICGITQQEMKDNFSLEIRQLAEANRWTIEEAEDRLKTQYDGYHFSIDNMIDIYNPFSLINALADKRLRNYWSTSGATTYILGFPNGEVRQALYEMVLPALAMRERSEIQSTQAFLRLYLSQCQLEEAKKTMKALIADVPYSNKKLASMDMEERYRLIMSTIFNAIGFRVEVERVLSTGRIDIVVETERYIYVIELKLSNNGGVRAAEKQILKNGYLEPFKADKRTIIGLAIELDSNGMGLIDWKKVN